MNRNLQEKVMIFGVKMAFKKAVHAVLNFLKGMLKMPIDQKTLL